MNPSKKCICIAISLAGAVILGGTAAVLIMKHRKARRNCSLFSCDQIEGQTAQTDNTIQTLPTTEVNCDEN